MSTFEKVASTVARITHRRYVITIGLLFLLAIAYVDRVNFSVASPLILKEFGISSGTYGLISSAFNWTYLVFLIPLGIAADRLSTRWALTGFIILWSIGAGITGFASGITVLLISRLIMGIGESPINTAGQVVIRQWTPRGERGIAASIFNSGSLVGPAIGSVIAASLIAAWGWRASFWTIGAFGVILGVTWYVIYSAPEKSRWLPKAESDYIVASRETLGGVKEGAIEKMSLFKLLGVPSLWGMALAQGTLVYTNYLFLTFLPLYLVQVKKLADFGAGWITGLIYGLATVGCLLIGYIADRVARAAKPGKRIMVRRWSMIIVIIGTAPLLVLPWVNSLPVIIALIGWVLSFALGGISLNWALAADLTVDKTSIGREFALITVGGNVFGLLAPIVTGYVVDATGSYTVPFFIAGGLAVVGAVVVALMVRRPLQRPKTLIEAERTGQLDLTEM